MVGLLCKWLVAGKDLPIALEHLAFMDDDELTQMPKRKWETAVAQARWATNQLADGE